MHSQAALAFSERDAGEALSAGAPTAEAFDTMLKDLAKGVAPRAGIEGVGCQKKLQRMIWCVRESIRQTDEEFLARSMCTTLYRDERQARPFEEPKASARPN